MVEDIIKDKCSFSFILIEYLIGFNISNEYLKNFFFKVLFKFYGIDVFISKIKMREFEKSGKIDLYYITLLDNSFKETSLIKIIIIFIFTSIYLYR